MHSPRSLSFDKVVATLVEANLLEKIQNQPPAPVTYGSVCTSPTSANPGDIFIAYEGVVFDGHQKIPDALKKQVGCIVCERLTPELLEEIVPTIVVSDSRAAWSFLAATMYDNPQDSLSIIGITGTNGKTSTVWLLKEMLRLSGLPYLTVGTLGFSSSFEGNKKNSHTTPDPQILFRELALARSHGVKFVVMEVSSHAVVQRKVAPIKFCAAGFTSLSRDHLDFHGNMKEYAKAKLLFVEEALRNDAVVFVHHTVRDRLQNLDLDLSSKVMDFGNQESGTWVEEAQPYQRECMQLDIQLDFAKKSGAVDLFGRFMYDNFLLANLIYSSIFHKDFQTANWRKIRQIPGRLERVPTKTNSRRSVYIDYAHTPDALEQAIQALKHLHPDSPCWVVFGCGGDRDRGKRSEMGLIASRLAAATVVTSDNPRGEAPQTIIDDITFGFDDSSRVHVEADRKKAIHFALTKSEENAVVLIAGKGPEQTQEIQGTRIAFSDKNIASMLTNTESQTC